MKFVKAIYPGTFDPLTNGHLDLIERGSRIVDELVVAILSNSDKGVPLFSVAERTEMIAEAIAAAGFQNVSVATFHGLLFYFCHAQSAKAVLRGIRAITDYEYEFPMAMMNRKLDPNLETLFMMPDRAVHLRQLAPHQGRLQARRRCQRPRPAPRHAAPQGQGGQEDLESPPHPAQSRLA